MDALIPLWGFSLCRKGYNKKKEKVPVSNIWNFNLGRLVVPNIYVNIELITTIAKNYKPNTREIVANEGDRLTKITRDVINEVFMLNPNMNWAIDPKELDA